MNIKFHYEFNKIIDKKALEGKGPVLFALIEGRFSILKDSEAFFDDRYMNLLELAVELQKWIALGIDKDDFYFVSIDHDQPILTFIRLPNYKWTINSIWKNGDGLETERDDLLSLVLKFINKIEVDLQERYNVSVFDYVDKD